MGKFCSICGAKTEERPIGRYNTMTGEDLGHFACRRGGCDHTGHVWKFKGGFFWRLLTFQEVAIYVICDKRGRFQDIRDCLDKETP